MGQFRALKSRLRGRLGHVDIRDEVHEYTKLLEGASIVNNTS